MTAFTFITAAARKLARMQIHDDDNVVVILEQKLKCGKKLFRTALARDCKACGIGSYNPEADDTIGSNSVAALDRLVPPVQSISRRSALARQHFLCGFRGIDKNKSFNLTI